VIVLIPLLDRWARSSQLQARRNAMLASTRLTQRRVEREEVDRYLTSHDRAARAVSAPGSGTGSRSAQVVAGR
jgi:hypothetical protein